MELSDLGVELEVGLRSQGYFPVPRLELLGETREHWRRIRFYIC